jgi:hypothetical protein
VCPETIQKPKVGFARLQRKAILMLFGMSATSIIVDVATSQKWYVQAAEKGHILSQSTLAEAYQTGDGVERDYQQAAKWYLRAANQGSFTAQLMLGIMYESGQGVPQDKVLAYRWLTLAASHAAPKKGDNPLDNFSRALEITNIDGAAKLRDALSREMTRSELAEAQKRTREWKPKVE